MVENDVSGTRAALEAEDVSSLINSFPSGMPDKRLKNKRTLPACWKFLRCPLPQRAGSASLA